MEEARNMVVGMKNTRARRVAMKRKDLYMLDIARSLFIKIIIKYIKYYIKNILFFLSGIFIIL